MSGRAQHNVRARSPFTSGRPLAWPRPNVASWRLLGFALPISASSLTPVTRADGCGSERSQLRHGRAPVDDHAALDELRTATESDPGYSFRLTAASFPLVAACGERERPRDSFVTLHRVVPPVRRNSPCTTLQAPRPMSLPQPRRAPSSRMKALGFRNAHSQ